MKMTFWSGGGAALALVAACGMGIRGTAHAQSAATPPTAHPIFVSVEGAALDDLAQSSFRQAAAKFGLGPVETVDIPALPKPKAPSAIAAGIAHVRELAFDEGRNLLSEALAEVNQTAGAGLSHEALCDLFLYLAMAQDRADWRDLPPEGPPAPGPEAGRTYLQAAVLCPARELYQRTFPPVARHRFAQAQAEMRTRGRGTLVVVAPADALISVDAGPLAPAPVRVTLPYGDHFVRVERPGRLTWATRVPLSLTQLQVDVPAQAFRTFPDNEAVAHARRMAAAYALVAELKPGADPLLELRLVEVATGTRIDSTRVPLQGEAGGVHAAVMRLDEQARKREMLGRRGVEPPAEDGPALRITSAPVRAPSEGPGPTEDPRGWARQRWPVLTAVGALVAASLILGVVVALDDQSTVE